MYNAIHFQNMNILFDEEIFETNIKLKESGENIN